MAKHFTRREAKAAMKRLAAGLGRPPRWPAILRQIAGGPEADVEAEFAMQSIVETIQWNLDHWPTGDTLLTMPEMQARRGYLASWNPEEVDEMLSLDVPS
jgi:hypothetical protein